MDSRARCGQPLIVGNVKEGFQPCASIEYFDKLFEFLQGNTEGPEKEVVKQFIEKWREPDGGDQRVRGWASHFQLWRNQDAEFQKVLDNPVPGMVYLAFDFAEISGWASDSDSVFFTQGLPGARGPGRRLKVVTHTHRTPQHL